MGGGVPAMPAGQLDESLLNQAQAPNIQGALVNAGIPQDIAKSRGMKLQEAKELMSEQFDIRKSQRDKKDVSKFSEGKLLASGFAKRMEESEKIIGELQEAHKNKSGAAPNEARTGLAGQIASVIEPIPSAGLTDALGAGIVRRTATPQQQQYLNAADNWIRANLRKESGASIPPEEMQQEYTTYFPMPGDSKEVIEQKRKSRMVTQEAVRQASGGSYELLNNEAKREKTGGLPDPLGLFQ
jgi:hypothetical protein